MLRLTIGDKNLSSWSLRPWLVLKVFEIAFEEDPVKLDRPASAEEIGRRSKAGLVPILHDGDFTVWDSLAIIEYLAERFPEKGIWPEDRDARAIARSVSAEMHSGFSALRALWPMQFARVGLGGAHTPSLNKDINRVDDIWRDCRKAYGAGGPFLFGKFSAADAMFAPVVSRFATYRGPCADPTIEAYREVAWSLPAMKKWGEGAKTELAS